MGCSLGVLYDVKICTFLVHFNNYRYQKLITSF